MLVLEFRVRVKVRPRVTDSCGTKRLGTKRLGYEMSESPADRRLKRSRCPVSSRGYGCHRSSVTAARCVLATVGHNAVSCGASLRCHVGHADRYMTALLAYTNNKITN